MRTEFYEGLGLDRGWSDEGPPAAAANEEAGFTMAQIAEAFGVTLRTLRFYETRGFLAPRRSGAARLYSQADCDRVALILRAKRLGFTLREIATLIEGSECGQDGGSLNLSRAQCTEQINLLERQKREIEAALAELRQVYSQHYLRDLGHDPAECH